MITEVKHITLSVRNLEESIIFYRDVLYFRLLTKWAEGASLYFLDPNDHKLEIHTSDLDTRIKTAKAHPWEELEFFF
jgi:catechol 2,3-dioxygenase-like lactoylglutathione lyase family enzyme